MKQERISKTAKRYSEDEKREIVDFVRKHNLEHRRGGVSAAVKKFGVSPITVNSWFSKVRQGTTDYSLSEKATPVEIYQRLAELHQSIEEKDEELALMRKEYDKLKNRLDLPS